MGDAELLTNIKQEIGIRHAAFSRQREGMRENAKAPMHVR